MLPVISDIVDFFFPPVCHLCGATLAPHEKFLCTVCVADMPRTHYHRSPGNQMEQRFAGLFPFERAAALFFYSRHSQLSTLMQDLKYRHFDGLATHMGRLAGTELATTGFFSVIDAIVPVPMHGWKKARRGYNQTEKIARGLSEITGIPVVTGLTASRPHSSQTRLSLAQRRANTDGIYSLRHPADIVRKHILLLDDVCTTGATLTACAEAILKDSPSTRLSLFTLGVTF